MADALTTRRAELNALNVYPVPDRDTGTNLAATARAARDALADSRRTRAPADDVGDLLGVLARGAVLGAHGNSGVIFAQMLRGLADSCAGLAVCEASALKKALRNASDFAYAAVAEPVEGTILTVARAAADGADSAPDFVPAVLAAALAWAHGALGRTTQQLLQLYQARVVDAGGAGLVVILTAMNAAVTGNGGPAELPGQVRPADTPVAALPGEVVVPATGGYEIQYLLHAEPGALDRLHDALHDLGDSVVIAGTGEGRWNVHIHAHDVAAVLAAGAAAGRVYRIGVSDLAGSAGTPAIVPEWGNGAGTVQFGDADARAVAIVAGAPSAGIARILRAEGVLVVLDGAQPASVEDWLSAIRQSGAASIAVLSEIRERDSAASNHPVFTAAAQARLLNLAVAVIPVRSPVQVLAAIAVHDVGRRFDDDVIAMAESAAATRWASVAFPAPDTGVPSNGIGQGPARGTLADDVVATGPDPAQVAVTVLERLLEGGGELVTIILGAAAPPGTAERITERLRGSAPRAEVTCYPGGQAAPALLLGVE